MSFSMNLICILIIIINLNVINCKDSQTVSVTIKNGQINGRQQLVDGKLANVFLGIPYAEPPIGDLRFRKALPVKQWSEPIEANRWGNPCVQVFLIDTFVENKNFSEDCLYLNVWSPIGNEDIHDQNLKAVLFWIHGGAHYFASANEYMYNGEMLSTKGDVVVVSVNYRLNTFGFFYAGTEEAPGNVGLWDQLLALEWVNDNIKYFGGDPSRVTIFGESAGGWSVSLHLLSPVARNLFQNAILMSGAALNHDRVSKPCAAKKFWLKAAKLVGCTDEDSKDDSFSPKIMDCMRKIDVEIINKIIFMDELVPSNTVWLPLPVIDGQYLVGQPIELLEKGDFKTDANVLIGTTSDEGTFVLDWIVDPVKYDKYSPHNLTHSQAFEELKRIATFYGYLSETDAENVAKTYLLNISPQSDDYDLIRRTIGVAFGDYLLGCPTILFAKALFNNTQQSGRVYQYYYDSKLGDPYKLICSQWMGSCHTNDLWPVFGIPFQQFDRHLNAERDESLQVIDFFSHFAKYGTPSSQNNIEWPSYYKVDHQIIAPYFGLTNEQNERISYFDTDLLFTQCEYLWRKYILHKNDKQV